MADATYQPKTYRKQGGDEYVVASGGALTIESGGSIANSGTITNSSAGAILESIVVEAIGATMANYGISSVGTSSGTTAYKLGAPVAGANKFITGSTSVGGAITITSTAATVGSTFGTITLSDARVGCHLVGLNTTNWAIVGDSTGAAFT